MTARARRGSAPREPAPGHISSLLDPALLQLGVQREVRQLHLQAAFHDVVGPALAPLCQAVSLDRGVLLVATRNSALAHQLQLEMPVITRALNDRLGPGSVRRLRFTPAG